MLQDRKDFTGMGAGGDFDSSPTKVLPNAWINCENCRTLTTDAGEVGNLESIGSTILIPNPFLPAGTNIEIGNPTEQAKNRWVSFNWNSNGDHGIYVYYVLTQTWYVAILDAQVTGGLNFDKNHYIHSARIINGSVYWTEFLQNQPRRFNIDAAIKMNDGSFSTTVLPYTSPLDISVISWIRRQPGLPPTSAKITQTSPVLDTNFIPELAIKFRYRYVYRDYEIGTASAYSLLQDFNVDGETFNRMDVAIPLQEKIQQDVLQVDLIGQYLLSPNQTEFVINSWNTKVAADAVAIAAHNAGTTALTYSFYNDKVGIALDAAYAAKPFDSFPIYCETIEIAKNRSFTGDYVIGYDTPVITSLAFTLVAGAAPPALVGEWHQISYEANCSGSITHYSNFYLYFATPPAGVARYYLTPGLGVVDPIAWAVLSAQPSYNSIFDIMNANAPGCGLTLTSDIDVGVPGNVTGGPTPSLIGQKEFKTGAAYQLSINFFDYWGRKCGILTTNVLKAQIPDRLYGDIKSIVSILWILNNAAALSEIPDWAYYYSIDVTKCLRTRFFLQMRAKAVSFAVKQPDGTYLFATTTWDPTLDGIGIDITSLDPYAMGYVFSEGDLVKFYIGLSVFTLSIIGQQDQWIVCQNANVGVLDGSAKVLFEIFIPYQQQTNEPYFEVSNIFPISNPGTNLRAYSQITGTISGDVFLLQRNDGSEDYLVETMSPNDKFYKLWFTDSGRSNFVDLLGQVFKTNDIAWSNTFIQGSHVNGLSTYDALDTKPIFAECGPLRKLQLTSKVEGEQGSIMLGICEKETASMYLGESQLLAATGNANVAISENIIGTINVLKGSFGTTDPESVYEFRGNVFWYNAQNGKYIQYSANGLFPVSNYKITRFWKLFSEQYLSMTKEEIEALGSRPFVFTAVDPSNWEVLVTVPRILSVPPKGYLPDYPDMIYPFDIYDGQAKTVVFKLSAEPNFWTGSYRHTPESMVVMNNIVYGFKLGQLYQYNSTEDYTINIFGTVYTARVMILGNLAPNRPKVFNNIAIEGNYKPSLTYFRTEPSLTDFNQFDLNEQASDLVDFDYEVKEGQLYSVIYRNKLVPTQSGLSLDGLLTAEKIRALTLKVLIEFTPTTQPLELRAVNLGFQVSSGHTT